MRRHWKRARDRVFGPDGPRTIGQFVAAMVVLGVMLYFLKGRGQGLNFWQSLLTAAVFAVAAILLRTVIERKRRG